MGYTDAPLTGVDIPDNNEELRFAYKNLQVTAKQLEPFVNLRFASMADMNAKLVGDNAPKNGMQVYIEADKVILGFVDNAWKRIYPTEKQIYSGTANPAATLGVVGDVYLQF